MAKYRRELPQLSGKTFITDGGMSATLLYRHNVELPRFAAFVLIDTAEGQDQLRKYYGEYLILVCRYHRGLKLDTPTCRAKPDWGRKLGYDAERLSVVDIAPVEMLSDLRGRFEQCNPPIVISGTVGPRHDGYKAGNITPAEAEDYHRHQIKCFAASEADMVAAYTLTTAVEAIGIAHAATAHDSLCSISFTVETDGRLVTGMPLGSAIEAVDAAPSTGWPLPRRRDHLQ